MKQVALPLLVGAVLAALPAPAAAQNVPPPSQAAQALQQAVQQNPQLPEIIRQRILQSGLTPEQIRARLQASGYAPNLLDAYLGGGAAGGVMPAPPARELGAIQALRLPPIEQNLLPLDTGLIRLRGGIPPSRLFGVGGFRRNPTRLPP